MMKDGKDRRFARVDFYALQLIRGILELQGDSDGLPTMLCRTALISRERARIAAMKASIWSYASAHHGLPTDLKPIGSPLDPNTGLPYQYKRTGPNSFTLKAVRVPGIGDIDLSAPPKTPATK
jgi:hypothetical protein